MAYTITVGKLLLGRRPVWRHKRRTYGSRINVMWHCGADSVGPGLGAVPGACELYLLVPEKAGNFFTD
jgi:hypothetical protein